MDFSKLQSIFAQNPSDVSGLFRTRAWELAAGGTLERFGSFPLDANEVPLHAAVFVRGLRWGYMIVSDGCSSHPRIRTFHSPPALR
jgi:hypothetical protein